jgi:hypothetical protein
LKTIYLFLKSSDLHVAVQRAGPDPQPFAAGLRLTAIISSLTRQRLPRRVFFVLVTKTPTILATISTQTERRNLMSPRIILPTEHELENIKVTHL